MHIVRSCSSPFLQSGTISGKEEIRDFPSGASVNGVNNFIPVERAEDSSITHIDSPLHASQ